MPAHRAEGALTAGPEQALHAAARARGADLDPERWRGRRSAPAASPVSRDLDLRALVPSTEQDRAGPLRVARERHALRLDGFDRQLVEDLDRGRLEVARRSSR